MTDFDGDGNLNTVEGAGFNSGDGNGDGIPDSAQQSVAGVPNPAIANVYTTLQATGGCNIVDEFEVVTEASRTAQDSTASYPLGLNNFTLDCASAGQSGTVTIFYDQVYSTASTWLWKKYNNTLNTYTDITTLASVSIGSQTVGGTPVTKVTFTVTDGGIGDEDGIANARIVDPIGPAVPVVAPVAPSGGGGGGGGGGYSPTTTTTITTGGGVVCPYGQLYSTTTGQKCTSFINGPDPKTQLLCTDKLAVSKPVSYVKRSQANKADIIIIKKFLNTYENANLVVNDIYDLAMFNAVVKWQEKYYEQVLKPWNLKKGTGYVFVNSIAQMKKQQLANCASQSVVPTIPAPITPTIPAQPVVSNSCFTQNLKRLAKGTEVTKLQNFLVKNGFMTAVPNGNFGPSTEQAVRDFQSTYPETYKTGGFIKPTGWFYSNTRAKANALNGCLLQ